MMAVDFGRQQRLGADDLLNLPIRIRKRSPLQELDAFPFFFEEKDEEDEEKRPAPSWMVRHGGACLAVLAVVSAVEAVVLGMLMR
jgi:hypothetical protein